MANETTTPTPKTSLPPPEVQAQPPEPTEEETSEEVTPFFYTRALDKKTGRPKEPPEYERVPPPPFYLAHAARVRAMDNANPNMQCTGVINAQCPCPGCSGGRAHAEAEALIEKHNGDTDKAQSKLRLTDADVHAAHADYHAGEMT